MHPIVLEAKVLRIVRAVDIFPEMVLGTRGREFDSREKWKGKGGRKTNNAVQLMHHVQSRQVRARAIRQGDGRTVDRTEIGG